MAETSFGPSVKWLNLAEAKKATHFLMIQSDLDFASAAFEEAARLPRDRLPARETDLAAEARALVDEVAVSKGVMRVDSTPIYANFLTISALFEAGVISYARCFNSNLRSALKVDDFGGSLALRKPMHAWMMRVRNKHVGHSDLKLERSRIGVSLIVDPHFGPRPSVMFPSFVVRRGPPSPEKLAEMAQHCRAVRTEYVDARLMAILRETRERLLRMPAEQIAEWPSLDDALENLTADMNYDGI